MSDGQKQYKSATNCTKKRLRSDKYLCSEFKLKERKLKRVKAYEVIDLTENEQNIDKSLLINTDIRTMNEWLLISPVKSHKKFKSKSSSGKRERNFETFSLGSFIEGNIFLNRLKENSNSKDEISFDQLVFKEGLLAVLLTSFTLTMSAIDALFGDLFDEETFHELVILCHYDLERRNCGMQQLKTSFSERDKQKIKLIFPKFPENSQFDSKEGKFQPGIQHSKLIILEYSNYLRIVISSQNMTDTLASQVIFVCDVPFRESKDKFGPDLAKFLNWMSPSISECLESYQTLKRFQKLLLKADFSQVDNSFDLVASKPGSFDATEIDVGLSRLKWLIKRHKIESDIVDSYSSSIGNLGSSLISDLSEAIGINSSKFSIIWPSVYQVCQNENLIARSCMFMTKNDSIFNSNPKSGQIFSLEEKFKPLLLSPERRQVMLHAKVIIGYNKEHIDFCYIGSHNMSQNAWGYWSSTEKHKQFKCSSFELGVFCFNRKILNQMPLPFLLTSRNYLDYRRSNDGTNELLVLGNEVSQFGMTVRPDFKEPQNWFPYSAIQCSQWRRVSGIVVALSKQLLKLNLIGDEKARIGLFFLATKEQHKQFNFQCKLDRKSEVIVVDLKCCDFNTKLFCYSLLSRKPDLKYSPLPIGFIYRLSLNDILAMSTRDIPPYVILENTEMNQFQANTDKAQLVEILTGIYIFGHQKQTQCLKNSCFSCTMLTELKIVPDYEVVSKPEKQKDMSKERTSYLIELVTQFDALVLSEVYNKASVYNVGSSKDVSLLVGTKEFLIELGLLLRAKKKSGFKLLFLLSIPEVGITKYLTEFNGHQGYRHALYRSTCLSEADALAFIEKLKLTVSNLLGIEDAVEVKFNFLFSHQNKVLPDLSSFTSLSQQWRMDHLKPAINILTQWCNNGFKMNRLCYLGRSTEDKRLAKIAGCKYLLAKDVFKMWKGIKKTFRHEIHTVAEWELLKAADTWLKT